MVIDAHVRAADRRSRTSARAARSRGATEPRRDRYLAFVVRRSRPTGQSLLEDVGAQPDGENAAHPRRL